MEEPPLREEEEEEEEDEAGPEGALGKSPLQLTAEDVYDISYVMGRELMALGSDPRVTQLQFKIVRVLEMLETLVNEGNLTVEELRMERDNLRKEVEGLRREGSAASPEVSAGEPGLAPGAGAGSAQWEGGRLPLLNIQAPQNKSPRVSSTQFRSDVWAQLLSLILLFSTPWTVAHQAPLSMGFSQARILEWVAMPSSRESSWPRDRTWISCVSCIGRWILYHCSWEAQKLYDR